MSVKELRSQTAEHMRNHADDFLPFLTNPDTGDMYTTGSTYRYKTVFYFNKGQSGFHSRFSAAIQMSLRSTAATWSTRQPGVDSSKWALQGCLFGPPRTISFDNLPVPVVPFQLRALTQVLQLPIDVVQSSSAAIKIGEEFDGEPITLVYVIASVAAIRTTVVDTVVDVTICMNLCVGLCPQVYAPRVWTRRALQFCGAAKGPG